jgi:acyl-CoA synthetase (NDP forming)
VYKAERIIEKVRQENRKVLLEPEAKGVCMDYGINVTDFDVAKSEEDALNIAEKIGFPVVLKIVSTDIIHKSDAGGVIVGLNTRKDVVEAYQKILENVKKFKRDAKIVGILVQEMAPASTEVIIGSIKDAQFGPTLMFGLGGIFVELLKDVTFRVAPINAQDAAEMIVGVKAYPLLNGYRNNPPVDVEAIVAELLKVSRLVMDHKEIKELDLNPVMAYPHGAKTVDARIVLE